ncbi:MAG: hypothetical protein JWP13_551 [Candidatus Saccharibacteria bacterium]|nr:hypothetical protein [Candidatus Saccharibacteria bacterium]
MVIVGICGAIGSGKSTFAELLTAIAPSQSIHLETSTLVIELANTFNSTLWSRKAALQGSNDPISLANKCIRALIPQLNAMSGDEVSVNQVLIDEDDVAARPEWYEKLFTYLVQAQQMPTTAGQKITAENKTHYRPLLQWIGGYFLYKLGNKLLWYEELLRRVQAAGPDIILAVLTAPRQPSEAEFVKAAGGKVIKIVRPGLISDTTDVTERQVANIIPDTIITNNGSVTDLRDTAKKVQAALLQDTLRASYSARDMTG